MLIGVIVGQFCDPIQGKQIKVLKPPLAPKGANIHFPTSPVFGGIQSDRLPYF